MSTIKSMNIKINEFSFKNNYLMGTYNFKPVVSFSIKNEKEKYELLMSASIINEKDNPFPIDLKASVSGVFEFADSSSEEIDAFLKKEGVQMVYPYLRMLVTNVSSMALVSPVVLPIIDVRNIILENKN